MQFKLFIEVGDEVISAVEVPVSPEIAEGLKLCGKDLAISGVTATLRVFAVTLQRPPIEDDEAKVRYFQILDDLEKVTKRLIALLGPEPEERIQ